jgi:hypothetical protein
MAALNTLAGRADLGVRGAVVPVEGYPEVAEAYAAWDEDNPCSPLLANGVAAAIAARTNEIRAAHPSVQFVVIVGSDESPMARVRTNPAQRARLRGGPATGAAPSRRVSRDTSSPTTPRGLPHPWLTALLPEVAVGRLVETPAEIAPPCRTSTSAAVDRTA